MKQYLVVAGNIGAGKSTLVELLARELGFHPYYEPVTENPYLELFYSDMERWAFHSQVFFLTHRTRSHNALRTDPRSVVQDRSIYEDARVFARNLARGGSLSDREWNLYSDLYETVIELLPKPDLVVYIRASVATLRRRIAKRGREFEASIEDRYLEQLNDLYDEWIDEFDLAPVLTINGDDLDFVSNEAALSLVLAQIRDALKGPQELLFPEDG